MPNYITQDRYGNKKTAAKWAGHGKMPRKKQYSNPNWVKQAYNRFSKTKVPGYWSSNGMKVGAPNWRYKAQANKLAAMHKQRQLKRAKINRNRALALQKLFKRKKNIIDLTT